MESRTPVPCVALCDSVVYPTGAGVLNGEVRAASDRALDVGVLNGEVRAALDRALVEGAGRELRRLLGPGGAVGEFTMS